MMNSLCGSRGSFRGSEITTTTSFTKQQPPSPTASVSESNVVASELDNNNNQNMTGSALQGIKFDVESDVEVQSPDNSLWETLFADQIDSPTDFMVSSPRRDFMVSSPRRDFMVSSPRRDYMISSPMRDYMVSSPKRDCMISSPKREYAISSPKREYLITSSPKREHLLTSSPKREYLVSSSPKRAGMYSIYGHNNGYMHGMSGHSLLGYSSQPQCNSHHIGGYKGKSQSPLHKVCSSSSPQYVHGENLSLPAMDSFLEDYQRDSYTAYPSTRASDIECLQEAFELPAASTFPSLLDYLSMPESRSCGPTSNMTLAAGLQMDREGDFYQMNHFTTTRFGAQPQEQQQQGELDQSLLGSVVAKSEQVEASYHGLLGPIFSEPEQEQDSGLQLVHLLLACAEAVAKDDYLSARRYLHHLNRVVSPVGDSMQRVAACFTDALADRLAATLTSSPSPSSSPRPFLPNFPDVLKIYQIVYQACPYVKFAHFTANQAIFEAFESEERVHVIDLEILQGYQWPAFMQALAARPGGPPSLRITGVGLPAESVRETGRRLAQLAHSLRVPFEFHAVAAPLEELRPGALHRRVGEALAVNVVNRLHRVPAPALGALLGMIRDQAPSVVTVVEQEASHNGPHFLGRFLEALHYYSAIFDSLDATFPADSVARARVEQYLFAPEIRNIVACEGPERIERHERLEKWRKIMEGKGFKGVPLSANAVNQSKILLGLYSCDGYRLTEDKGCLLLGWQDRAIVAASAWRC